MAVHILVEGILSQSGELLEWQNAVCNNNRRLKYSESVEFVYTSFYLYDIFFAIFFAVDLSSVLQYCLKRRLSPSPKRPFVISTLLPIGPNRRNNH